MKIIVLEGEDTHKSYERLMKFVEIAKKRGWEIVNDEFPATPSLFGTDRLIIYRDYRKLLKSDIKNFDRYDGTLVIYHEGSLPAGFIKVLPADFKLEKFELPKLLFTFLESLSPGSSKRSIKLLHEIVKTEPVELVFFMLCRHFRDLYWVKAEPKSAPFPLWRIGKLKQQSSNLTIQQLQSMIQILADIDVKVKTSKADLLSSLDLFILKQLE